MNRKLQYVNEHQKCIVVGYKRELEACRQQLVEARVSLADSRAERGEGGDRASRNTRTTEQELKMVNSTFYNYNYGCLYCLHYTSYNNTYKLKIS